jgi:hypothetical protein
MKQTGINDFVDKLGLSSGNFRVFYTFEEGAGSVINSVPNAQSLYTGSLSSVGDFWSKPGSGYVTGNYITVQNASGINSNFWTSIFAYEKVNERGTILFSSLAGTSGYEIGITDSNKLYFKAANQISVHSSTSLGSKGIVSVGYMPNNVTLGCYNPNAQTMESQSFNYNFGLTRSDDWKLMPGTGYIDYYLHFDDCYSSRVLSQLGSGFWAYFTGIIYPVTTYSQNVITGYQTITVNQTGITGYQISTAGGGGINYYTGEFPSSYTSVPLTGIYSSSTYSSGVSGLQTYLVTGTPIYGYQILSGYISSFGMDKIQIIQDYGVDNGDFVKVSSATLPFDNNYNYTTSYQYLGFLAGVYNTGLFNIFQNGLAVVDSGWLYTGGYLYLTGANVPDVVTFDLVSGNQILLSITGNSMSFSYTGQEVYLNGVNLASGRDFVTNGTNFVLTGNNTGLSGFLFDFPYGFPPITGFFTVRTGVNFLKGSSQVYINGIRQVLGADYVEGTRFDMLSGNYYNNQQGLSVFTDDSYWN